MLEPLRRNETPFLRQVADGASIARDIGPGCTVMGDFWHMGLEETSFMGAFISGGDLLTAGGRVLAVTGLGDDVEAARAVVYSALERIEFQGMHYRKDIGHVSER